MYKVDKLNDYLFKICVTLVAVVVLLISRVCVRSCSTESPEETRRVNAEIAKRQTTIIEKEARAFGKALGVEVSRVVCTPTDTDGDEYVSCTISTIKNNGDVSLIPIECAGYRKLGTGCRQQMVIYNGK